MLKRIIDTIILIIIGVIFVVVFSAIVWSFMSVALPVESKSSREIVEKQSEKSLYFGLRYQVVTGYDKDADVSFVSKKQFNSLELGDTISGYNTSEFGFMTKWDYVYEGLPTLLIAGVIGGLGGTLAVGGLFFIPYIDRLFSGNPEPKTGKERRKQKRKEKKRERKRRKPGMILHIILLIGLLFCTQYTVNTLLKIMPFGKTTTEAEIVKRDYWTSRGGVTAYLTVEFTANDGKEYRVNKKVTNATYQKNEGYATVEISYQNQNPYNIFINMKSIWELIWVVFSPVIFFIGMAIVLLIMIIYVYWKWYKEVKSEKERQIKNEERRKRKGKGKPNLKSTHQKNRR